MAGKIQWTRNIDGRKTPKYEREEKIIE